MYAVPPYFITSLSGSTTVATGDPMQALHLFETSTYPGVWPHLDKGQILKDIALRLHSPSLLRESMPFLSGVTAVLFNLIKKNPFRYVRLCHSLFETGGFQTLQQRIQSSEHLRLKSLGHYDTACSLDGIKSSPAEYGMSPVDWMLMLTLHETQLAAFAPPSFMPLMPSIITQHQQMTKPWELKGWLSNLLGYQQVHYHHAHVQPMWVLMRRAAQAIASGGVAIALVNAEAMVRGLRDYPVRLDETTEQGAGSQISRPGHPDSWVTLTQVNYLPPWYMMVEPSSLFEFTFHCLQENIFVCLDGATLSQSCWGLVTAL